MRKLIRFIKAKITRKIRPLYLSIFWITLIFSLGIIPGLTQLPPTSPSPTAVELVQQGEKAYQQGNLLEAVDHLQAALKLFQSQGETQKLAITATNLCRIQTELGNPEDAVKTCQIALDNYGALKDNQGTLYAYIYQANALKQLGLSPQASSLLIQGLGLTTDKGQPLIYQNLTPENINNYLLPEKLTSVEITAWRNLAEILRSLGKLPESKMILESLKNAPNDPDYAATLLSLGNTLTDLDTLAQERKANVKYFDSPWQCPKTLQSYSPAKDYYREVSQLSSSDKTIQISAQMNRLNYLTQTDNREEAKQLARKIGENLQQLPNRQFKVYVRINYAHRLACLSLPKSDIIEQLNLALKEARELNNRFLESQALGNLGGFYESQNQWQKAQELTEKALYLAQPKSAPAIAYQWQWQLGRIFAAQGKIEQAITSYQQAVTTLETLRKDLLSVNSDVQFSFRDQVEPLYRQLVNLMLSQQDVANQPKQLEKTLSYVEGLQLAELENFLQCRIETSKSISTVDLEAAIIYPILFPERLDLILSLPDQPLKYYRGKTLDNPEETISNMRQELIAVGARNEIIRYSKQLYEWMIDPLEDDLKNTPQITTLVFVLDGSLRNIPIGTLYDQTTGQYLLEKYAIAVTPNLKILTPQPLQRTKIRMLAAGISESVTVQNKTFSSLPQVTTEFEQLKENFPAEVLLNETFTEDNLRQKLEGNSFSIIHFSTHGEFSSNPDSTFILSYDDLLITPKFQALLQLSQLRGAAVDLLVLSACQTAEGDRRAALGLAGIAVSSGASSTLGTLWSVEQESTPALILKFYQNLSQNPGLSKAKALQQAQLQLLSQEPDPYYWGSFVLVGNWL